MSCQIICEVIAVDGPVYCSGAAKMKLGNIFLAGLKTPEPVGMCAKAYVAL